MNQSILFSPVGGTDPISMANYHDGALLHICRYFKPTKVIMYMSKEILDLQEQDNRYLYCLQQLMELQNRTFDIEIIRRPDLTDVQEFDYFYQDFREIIEDIMSGTDGSDKLYLNVSSGTPAMKGVLTVLKTVIDYNCDLIQVVTPVKHMNEHEHQNYDVKFLWEADEDNADDAENRCRIVKCPTLSKIKQEEIIKQHISEFEYSAAASIASKMPAIDTANYLDLLHIAAARLLLNFPEVDKLSRNARIDFTPVKASSDRKYFEYELALEIKLYKHEYGDFVRAISPLIVELFELIVKRQYKIAIDDFCYYDRQNVRKWSRDKLGGTELLRALQSGYDEPFQYGFVKSDHFKFIICYYAKDQNLIKLVDNLRNVELNIRNLAAHEIVSIDNDVIVQRTGYTVKQLVLMLRQLFAYANINIKNELWDSYKDMNAFIIQSIGN